MLEFQFEIMLLKCWSHYWQQLGGCKTAIQYSAFEIQGPSRKERWRFLRFQFIFQWDRVNQKLFKHEFIVSFCAQFLEQQG